MKQLCHQWYAYFIYGKHFSDQIKYSLEFFVLFFKLDLKSSLEIDHNCTVKPKEIKQKLLRVFSVISIKTERYI